MVEQWSSKSHVWVRFLLSLILYLNKLSIFRKSRLKKTYIARTAKTHNVNFSIIAKTNKINRTLTKNKSESSLILTFNENMLNRSYNSLNNNWTRFSLNQHTNLSISKLVHFKKISYNKTKLRLKLTQNFLKNTLYYLSYKKNSISSLKRLLGFTFTNLFHSLNHKINTKSRINTLLNLYSHSQIFGTNVSLNRLIRSDRNKTQSFYLNSILNKKASYIRSFSRSNKTKLFVSFKTANNYSYISNSIKLSNFSNSKVNSIYLLSILFNSLFLRLPSNPLNKNIVVNYPYSFTNPSLFDCVKTYTNSRTHDSLSLTISKNVLANKYLSLNVNSSSFVYSSLNGFYANNTTILNLSNLSISKIIKSNNLFDRDLTISVLWSNFWNTLFLSKTKSMSANSLFMAVSSSDQEYFLGSQSFFADFKFGNFYLNYVPYQLPFNSNVKGTLSLTLKYTSSFFKNLKWRKSSVISTTNSRLDLLTKSYENDFLFLYNEDYNDKISDLMYIKHLIKPFSKCNLTNISPHTSLKKGSIINKKSQTNKFTRFLKAISFHFRKNIPSASNTRGDDFQLITRTRHNFINKELSFFVNTEQSLHNVKLKNVDYNEGFYKIQKNSIYYHKKKITILQSSSNIAFAQICKLSDFISVISNPTNLKLSLKDLCFTVNSVYSVKFLYAVVSSLFFKYFSKNNIPIHLNYLNSNLIPNHNFSFSIFKKISGSFADGVFTMSSTPWHYNSIIRFMEFCSGKKVLFQFYPFLFQSIEKYYVVTYKRWMTRMTYYERKLGHKFFLEEALHLIHLTLNLHDPKVMCTWLKAIIQRISFWKTRSIFRFLKYLFSQYFNIIMNEVGSKGLKICLRGKISAAGNSRTRTILYRTGQTSHANTSLKVLNEFMTIGTFTGVMGFQIWIFY